jgi:hypothetical protein
LFIKNYKATCERSRTKHDLARVYQKPSELLRSYIRLFFKVRNRIPNILESEVIPAFINGLYHHNKLRRKFNRKPPVSIGKMFTTANQYTDVEEADYHGVRIVACIVVRVSVRVWVSSGLGGLKNTRITQRRRNNLS